MWGQPAAVAGAHGQRCCPPPFPKPSAPTFAADTVTASLGSLSLWLLLEPWVPFWWLCPPSRAGLLPIYERLELWWCASWGQPQNLPGFISTPQEGPVWTERWCLRCSAHMRENCFLPSFCCAFLHYYQLISALCLECLTEILSEKENFFPLFLGMGLRGHLSDRPHVLRTVFPSLSTGAWYWNKLIGLVWLFQKKFFSAPRILKQLTMVSPGHVPGGQTRNIWSQ